MPVPSTLFRVWFLEDIESQFQQDSHVVSGVPKANPDIILSFFQIGVHV